MEAGPFGVDFTAEEGRKDETTVEENCRVAATQALGMACVVKVAAMGWHAEEMIFGLRLDKREQIGQLRADAGGPRVLPKHFFP
jgi:hypothetical protein